MSAPIETSPDDERWIAKSDQLPGIKCYAATKEGALAAFRDRARDIIAERRERGLEVPPAKLTVIVYENRKEAAR